MSADVAFDLAIEHGRCVGVHIPPQGEALAALAIAVLSTDERRFAEGLAPLRRRTWVGGRVALRAALVREGIEAPSILPDARGAPGLPAGIAGSITHKQHMAAALVARESSARVGIDLELDVSRTGDIAALVLTGDELVEVAPLGPEEQAREVLLRFSAKEAIYKAIDPFVRRFVGFREVAVSPRAGGSAAVRTLLARGEGPFTIDVRWRRFDGIVLTSARVEAA